MNLIRASRCGSMLGLLLLAACATTSTGSDHYPQADFSGYQTYAWISEDPLIRPRGASTEVSPLTLRRISEAVESGLAAKGYRRVESPQGADFVVAFTVGARDRIDADAYPAPFRGPWLWGWDDRRVDVRVYREGTLSIDFFDGKTRQPVWHGWARKTITSADVADPGPAINDAVARILRAFPPQP